MTARPGFNYRNLLILQPLLGVPIALLFLSVMVIGIFVDGRDGKTDVVAFPVYGIFIGFFIFMLIIGVRSVLVYFNERIVLTETTLEWYSCIGELKKTIPLTAIQRMESSWTNSGIVSYVIRTDSGNRRCSSGMMQFQVFKNRIATIIEQNQRDEYTQHRARQREH